MTLLREGMEVVVHFLGGDPDRPIIMGCVYDGVNAPPLLLPDESSCTVFRSNSTPGGRGFNEVVVDDRDGAEVIRVRAQRDFEERVRRDRTARIDRDDATMVRGGRSAVVVEHDTLRVGKHLVLDAGAGVTIRVGESVLQILPDRVVIASPRVLLNCEGSVQTPDLSVSDERGRS
jgi:type VI secretion system secreted protein VgrG